MCDDDALHACTHADDARVFFFFVFFVSFLSFRVFFFFTFCVLPSARCLDVDYLILKTFLLERFLHDFIFESMSPNTVREFLGVL